MSKIFPLEEFLITSLISSHGQSNANDARGLDAAKSENIKTHAYETGYSAGWEDAVTAQANDQNHIGAELAKSLQDLGFTFHEARVQVMKSLEPLLLEITRKVLPEVISKSIAQTIVEELIPFAETVIDSPVEIVVAPINKLAMESMLGSTNSIPVILLEEPTLGAGQAVFRAGQMEKHVDLDDSVARITNAIQSIYQLNEKEFAHG